MIWEVTAKQMAAPWIKAGPKKGNSSPKGLFDKLHRRYVCEGLVHEGNDDEGKEAARKANKAAAELLRYAIADSSPFTTVEAGTSADVPQRTSPACSATPTPPSFTSYCEGAIR